MQAPNADQIEIAADQLKTVDRGMMNSQIKELREFGDVRASAVGAHGCSPDFVLGYVLALQTARVVLAQSVALAMAKVPPETLL